MRQAIMVMVILLLAACSRAPNEAAIQTAIEQTKIAQPPSTSTLGPTITQISSPSFTPKPTSTPEPTNTPKPTNTPLPTATPTPEPQPIILTGKGDSVLDVEKWSGPALAKIKYNGGSNFAVINYDTQGERIDLLVNTIGKYEGIIPLDFIDGEGTARLEVKASGEWEIQILPIDRIELVAIPTTIQGVGDYVVGIRSGNPDLLIVDASKSESNFALFAYASEGRDLLVNEIAPYTGTVIVPSGTYVLVIVATGPWSIEATAK